MEKEIYYTLQEIKGILNRLNYEIPRHDETIEILNHDIKTSKKEVNDTRRLERRETRDYHITNVVTLGKYRKQNKFYHLQESLVLKMAEAEALKDYQHFTKAKEKEVEDKKKDEIKQEVYKKNYEQINMFLELCEKLTEEEKEKVFSYKIRSKSEGDETLMKLENRITSITAEVHEIEEFLKQHPKTAKSEILLENCQKISLALAEISLGALPYIDKSNGKAISAIFIILAIKNIIVILKRDIDLILAKTGYKMLEDSINDLNAEKQNLIAIYECIRAYDDDEEVDQLEHKIIEEINKLEYRIKED